MSGQRRPQNWAQIAGPSSTPKPNVSPNMWPALPQKQANGMADQRQRHPDTEKRKAPEVKTGEPLKEEGDISDLTAEFMALEASILNPRYGKVDRAKIRDRMFTVVNELNRLKAIQSQELKMEAGRAPTYSSMQKSSRNCTTESVQKITKFNEPRRVERWIMESGGEQRFLVRGQAEALGNMKMALSWFGHQYLRR